MTAADQSREYGEANPELTGTVTGVKNDDKIDALPPATEASPVGSYAIVAGATGDALGNYDVKARRREGIVVGNAPLVVKVVDSSKVYGDENPAFAVRFDGFVLGQDAGVLGGELEPTPPRPPRPVPSAATASRRPGWRAATTPSSTPGATSR